MKTVLDRNGRDTEAEQTRWVERYRASGSGLKRFAAQHGLSAGQLHYWTYRQRGSGPATAVFQEVRMPTSWPTAHGWIAEISLPDGTTLRLDARAEVAWVRSLVESLRGPCSH